jgi:hypothetical protein
MLAPDHADRRQLGDLVATERMARPALLLIELAPASAARFRKVIDDLIDLILWLQFPARTLMPELPTSRTPLALPPRKLLRLRAGLRPPLLTRLRRSLRRRF